MANYSSIEDTLKEMGVNNNSTEETEVSNEEVKNEVPEGNSEPEETKDEVPPESPEAPAEDAVADTGNNEEPAESKEVKEPEAKTESRKQEKPRYTRLQKAEYNATKYKQKYRSLESKYNELQGKFDELYADYKKYEAIDPSQIENEQDRHRFLAWQAQAEQKLNDWQAQGADIRDAMADQVSYADDEIYNAKIDDCYNEDDAEQFRALDEEYHDALDYGLEQSDPDDIVKDFLKGNPYEPAIRDVLMRSDDICRELLIPKYNNRRLEGDRKLGVIKRLAASVRNYFEGAANPQPQKAAKPEAKPVVAASAAPAKPRVTGSLVKGNSVGVNDMKSEANDLAKMLGC